MNVSLISARIIVDADKKTVTAEQNRRVSNELLEDVQDFCEESSKTPNRASRLNSNGFYKSMEYGRPLYSKWTKI